MWPWPQPAGRAAQGASLRAPTGGPDLEARVPEEGVHAAAAPRKPECTDSAAPRKPLENCCLPPRAGPTRCTRPSDRGALCGVTAAPSQRGLSQLWTGWAGSPGSTANSGCSLRKASVDTHRPAVTKGKVRVTVRARPPLCPEGIVLGTWAKGGRGPRNAAHTSTRVTFDRDAPSTPTPLRRGRWRVCEC